MKILCTELKSKVKLCFWFIFRFEEKTKSESTRCLNQPVKNWRSKHHSVPHSIHDSQTPTKPNTALSHSSISIDARNCAAKTTSHVTTFKRCSRTFAQMPGSRSGKIKCPTELSQSKSNMFNRTKHTNNLIMKQHHCLGHRALRWRRQRDGFVVFRWNAIKGRIPNKPCAFLFIQNVNIIIISSRRSIFLTVIHLAFDFFS